MALSDALTQGTDEARFTQDFLSNMTQYLAFRAVGCSLAFLSFAMKSVLMYEVINEINVSFQKRYTIEVSWS